MPYKLLLEIVMKF